MPNKTLCPKCHGQRTTSCLACRGTGKRSIVGIPLGNCKACGGTGRRRCEVCGGGRSRKLVATINTDLLPPTWLRRSAWSRYTSRWRGATVEHWRGRSRSSSGGSSRRNRRPALFIPCLGRARNVAPGTENHPQVGVVRAVLIPKVGVALRCVARGATIAPPWLTNG